MGSNRDSSNEQPNLPSPKNIYKDPDDGRQRFLLELEFIQCLANPTYIHYLAQNRYFEDEAFIGYLKYLQYWQRPEYIKYIMYPHCLFFLELLQNPNFRNAMAHPGSKELAHRQQFYFWKNYRNNRLKHILPKPLPEPAAAPPTSVPPPLPPPTIAAAPVPSPSAGQVLSPMQYGMPPGSALARNDIRSSTVDRRKRNLLQTEEPSLLGIKVFCSIWLCGLSTHGFNFPCFKNSLCHLVCVITAIGTWILDILTFSLTKEPLKTKNSMFGFDLGMYKMLNHCHKAPCTLPS